MDSEKIILLFQFNSTFYNRNRLEKMVRDAANLAENNLSNVSIQYERINIDPSQSIINDIIKNIDESAFCVFELSDFNANVLFQLGYSYSKGKGVAILKNRSSDVKIPTELSEIKFLDYDDSNSLSNLSLDLSLIIEEYINKTVIKKYNYLLRNVWSFKPNERILFVSGNLKGKYMVLPPDANALMEAILTVKTLYPESKNERYYAIDFPQELCNSMSIVSVGGPSSNQITRYFLDKVNFPWDYVRPTPEDKQEMVNHLTQEKRCRILDSNGQVKKDYGFFIKFPNPDSEKNYVILITAMTTEGVLGTAKSFAFDGEFSETNCLKILNQTNAKDGFAAITETIVENQRILSRPISKEVYTYKMSTNSWTEI